MKNKLSSIASVSIVALLVSACGGTTTVEESHETTTDVVPDEVVDDLLDQAISTAAVAPEGAKLKVYEAPPAPAFPNASMGVQVKPNQSTGAADFEYNITNYELAIQTPDAATRGCANSDKGQHIHFILNNKPYIAKYEAKFTEQLDPGVNVLLSFLSRSYHESLKEQGAFTLTKINMPGEGGTADFGIYEDPTLYYSRPKGDYKKSSGDKVLLDFFAMNCTLAPNNYRVRATIDGEVWMLNKWAAYFIEGMEVGAHTVRLELIDANGDQVAGPFNDSGERTFNITEG